jgi:flavin-dependent dehydrogenase
MPRGQLIEKSADVIIAGGGLAGLTAAIHLSRLGYDVIVLEKEAYPHHKVCGEYISNEVLPYLKRLDADPSCLGPAVISHLEFSMVSGKKLSARLPLGGFGLSRYRLDHYLCGKAQQFGAAVYQEQVTDIRFPNDLFEVSTASGNTYKAKVAIGASGKRSSIDVKLERDFIGRKSPWLAVKGHYRGDHPEHVVGLHQFDGGYCGVSRVEDDTLNICYLVQFSSFKKYKNINSHREEVLYKNPALRNIFTRSVPLFEKPLTISQVSFARKATVERHMLMIGDTAGLIHPLCGNGMAMAIHSAKIAAGHVADYLDKRITRMEMEQAYTQAWNRTFRKRLNAGSGIAALLQHSTWAKTIAGIAGFLPGLLPVLIRQTHGRPIETPVYPEDYEI